MRYFVIDPKRLPPDAVAWAASGKPIPLWPGYEAMAKSLAPEAAEFEERVGLQHRAPVERGKGAIELAIYDRLSEREKERYRNAIDDYYDDRRSAI